MASFESGRKTPPEGMGIVSSTLSQSKPPSVPATESGIVPDAPTTRVEDDHQALALPAVPVEPATPALNPVSKPAEELGGVGSGGTGPLASGSDARVEQMGVGAGTLDPHDPRRDDSRLRRFFKSFICWR